MNILITDYYCASNRGDAAILEGVYQSLQREYPDADITVMTEHPDAAELVHGIDAVKQTFAGFDWRISKKNLARAYLSITSPLYRRGRHPLGFNVIRHQGNLDPYLKADLVVSTGGQFLTDIYFPSKVGVLWEHLYLSQIDTPSVIYAQTLGPFKRSPYRRMVRHVLDRMEVIITRDEQSKQNVEELGVSTPVYATADAAFAMSLDSPRQAPLDAFQLNEDLPPDSELTVSISAREWAHTKEGTTEDDYVVAIANTIDWLVSSRDANVVFASTCTGLEGYNRDDRTFAARILNRMEYDESAQILSGEYRPHELVEIYDHMDLHIGMRMHSNILAMMAETPVIPIQYQFKTKGLAKKFGILPYLVNVDDVTGSELASIVKKAMENRSELRNIIKSRLTDEQYRAKQTANLVSEEVEINRTP